MWWTPRTTVSGYLRKRDLVQGLGPAPVGSRPRMASLASIWSYLSSLFMDWPELESCHTGWPLPTGEPNILKTSTAGQIFRWNLYKRCQTQKMAYVSVRHGWWPTRKDVQRRTSASRVSWFTSKNEQTRRSGRGEWDISARSARSSTTTLRIAGRIQTLRRAVLMLEMAERVK